MTTISIRLGLILVAVIFANLLVTTTAEMAEMQSTQAPLSNVTKQHSASTEMTPSAIESTESSMEEDSTEASSIETNTMSTNRRSPMQPRVGVRKLCFERSRGRHRGKREENKENKQPDRKRRIQLEKIWPSLQVGFRAVGRNLAKQVLGLLALQVARSSGYGAPLSQMEPIKYCLSYEETGFVMDLYERESGTRKFDSGKARGNSTQ